MSCTCLYFSVFLRSSVVELVLIRHALYLKAKCILRDSIPMPQNPVNRLHDKHTLLFKSRQDKHKKTQGADMLLDRSLKYMHC